MPGALLIVKGLTLKSRLDFAREEGGERLLQRLRETPGPAGAIATTPMLSMRQFLLAEYDALCRTIARLIGKDPEAIFRRMGAFQADAERRLQNVSLGKKTDPLQLLSGLTRNLPVQLAGASGTLAHEPAAGRLCRLRWRGHGETSDSFCLAALGYAARLLENAGVAGVTAGNRECLARGGDGCVWDFMWEKVSGMRRDTIDLRELSPGA